MFFVDILNSTLCESVFKQKTMAKSTRGSSVFLPMFYGFFLAASVSSPALANQMATIDLTVEHGMQRYLLKVEVAMTEAQRTCGLMNRAKLPEHHGMLFVYTNTRPGTSGFWMYRTRLPLDIAFIDAKGTIVSMRQMQPCINRELLKCPTYAAGADYQYALEVNKDFFRKRDIGIGDKVVFDLKGMRVPR